MTWVPGAREKAIRQMSLLPEVKWLMLLEDATTAIWRIHNDGDHSFVADCIKARAERNAIAITRIDDWLMALYAGGPVAIFGSKNGLKVSEMAICESVGG